MSNSNWIDTGKTSEGVFAKHRFRCANCGYEVESRHVPKEFCPECAKEMQAKFDIIKVKFGK